ncbi:MAG: Hpt domain-containing protein [bacterium]|nr:Hpt domain-containing protein [bacterium]
MTKPNFRADQTAALEPSTDRKEEATAAAPSANTQRVDGGRTQEPTIDITVLDELSSLLTKGGTNIVERVIDAFLESSQDVMRQLADALDADDYERAALATHTLKSSSAQVGGTRLHSVVTELEEALRAGDAIEVHRLHADLEREYPGLRGALAIVRGGVHKS